MRFRTSLVLLFLVAALGGYAWLYELKRPPGPEQDRAVFSLRAEALQQVAIRKGAETMAFERDDQGWRMTQPMRIRADAKALDDLLGDLERLEVAQRLPDARPAAAYGLSPPAASLTFSRGGREPTEGLVLGEDCADGRTAYACRSGLSEVILIPKAFADRLRKGVNDFRDRGLLGMPKARVLRFSLTYPDRRVTVARKEGGWRVEEPVQAAAGSDETDRALDTFAGCAADTFVTDDAKDLAAWGLDRPRLEVRSWDRSSGEPTGFAIGSKLPRQPFANYDTFHARPLGTSTVVTVKVAREDEMVKEVKHFRPRRLLEGSWDAVRRITLEGPGGTLDIQRAQSDVWEALGPHPGELDTSRFNDRVATPLKLLEASEMEPAEARRLAQLGFDRPLGRITISREGGGRQVLTLGSLDAGTREAFATASGEDLVFTVPAATADLLALPYAQLRSTKLLWTALSALQGIELIRPDGDLVFSSPAKGSWVQEKPERREGPLPGLSALAERLTALNAERWISFGKVDWAAHGLAPPAATVKVTYAEGSAPPRTCTLELGLREPQTGAVYARFDRADALLTVAPRILDLVLADPAKAPAP